MPRDEESRVGFNNVLYASLAWTATWTLNCFRSVQSYFKGHIKH